jgi:hypothetical protein
MQLAPLAADRAARLISAFSGAHVLVVGDAMLDKFIVGRVTRISPRRRCRSWPSITSRIASAARRTWRTTWPRSAVMSR